MLNIEELEKFFNSTKLPDTFIFNGCERVNDVRVFVDTHIGYIRRMDEKTARPYLLRLQQLYESLKNQ